MLRFIPVLALLLFTACGLAENEQDDKNKRIYITFADPAFERFCLGMFDLDHDGRISRYEAQRVLAMDCSGRNISAMWEIGEFSRLRELDCSGNNLTRLDLRKCPRPAKARLRRQRNHVARHRRPARAYAVGLCRKPARTPRPEIQLFPALARLPRQPAGDARPAPPARGSCRPTRATILSLRPSIASLRRASTATGRPRWSSADRPPASFSADCPRRFPSPARIASCRLLRCLLLPPPALSFAFRGGFPVRLFLIHC